MTDSVAQGEDNGQSVLSKISTEVVRTLKESFGKGPVKAKSYLLDDFLLVVMRGGATVAEETMLERGHGDMVRQFRQTYQNEMGDSLIAKIESLTRRKVVNYQSQVLFDPQIVIEIFFFAPEAGGQADESDAPEIAI
jgi:uncharacterized protein YbcI